MRSGHDPAIALQRVLVLERQQGFHDRAAVGGLTAFARTQVVRANGLGTSGLEAAADLLAGYADADRRHREMAVSGALNAVLTGSASSVPPPQIAHKSTALPNLPDISTARPKLTVVRRPEDIDTPITGLKGIGKATERTFGSVGVATPRDLLFYFPRTHYDYTDSTSISRMRIGHKTTLVGTIENVRTNRTKRGVSITTVTLTDDTGSVGVRWFNQPFLVRRLPVGARVAVTGEPEIFNGFVFFQPRDYELIESEDLTHAARLVPIYPLTKGLYQRSLRELIRHTIDEYTPVLEDHLPPELCRRLRLPHLGDAIREYHFPGDEQRKARSQQRLAFDELLLIQLGLLRRKREWQKPAPDVAIRTDESEFSVFTKSLPFSLTGAQNRAIGEILDDMARPIPMSRLLQGDVGSGKTVVAAAALLATVHAGKQAVMMAPTEILAEQHYRTISELLQPFAITCELLIGSTPKKRKASVYEAARNGVADVIIGTHALIQEGVEFTKLGLAITDEQHRFGVEQRALLRQKGLNPHILAMTATPIPRTLAMTIYGELDVGSIDEMPPGRLPVITTWSRTPREAYGVVRDEVARGHQAFVICPVIEESADSDMRSVMAEHKELQTLVFPDLHVGLLHGKMKGSQKDATLNAFRSREYEVLVATSVVEVGIDIPNATVMVIRDAHRFGLAQLHQFRGRVGRGGDQAFCVLLSTAEGDDARERLEALTGTDNGFELAEEDLRLRGPGEFWGLRQSGLPELKIATLGDLVTIEMARTTARDILDRDPELSNPEHELLRRQLHRFWDDSAELS